MPLVFASAQLYSDFRNHPEDPMWAEVPKEFATMDLKASLSDKNVEKAMIAASKVRPLRITYLCDLAASDLCLVCFLSCRVPSSRRSSLDLLASSGWVTSTPPPSTVPSPPSSPLPSPTSSSVHLVYMFLCLADRADQSSIHFPSQVGKRVLAYSYGSGAAASVFAMKIKSAPTEIAEKLQFTERLDAMDIVPCEDFVKCLKVRHRLPAAAPRRPRSSSTLTSLPSPASPFPLPAQIREETHNAVSYTPIGSLDNLWDGAYYLAEIDSMFRRRYEIKA